MYFSLASSNFPLPLNQITLIFHIIFIHMQFISVFDVPPGGGWMVMRHFNKINNEFKFDVRINWIFTFNFTQHIGFMFIRIVFFRCRLVSVLIPRRDHSESQRIRLLSQNWTSCIVCGTSEFGISFIVQIYYAILTFSPYIYHTHIYQYPCRCPQ